MSRIYYYEYKSGDMKSVNRQVMKQFSRIKIPLRIKVNTTAFYNFVPNDQVPDILIFYRCKPIRTDFRSVRIVISVQISVIFEGSFIISIIRNQMVISSWKILKMRIMLVHNFCQRLTIVNLYGIFFFCLRYNGSVHSSF